MFNSPSTVVDQKKSNAEYQEARVIVLDDSFNTFQHVVDCILAIIPGMIVKRAGLDYWPLVSVSKYENFDKFLASKARKRIISFSKKNGIYLKDFKFNHDDILLFGREDSGLPDSIINKSDFLISIFMPNLQTGYKDKKGVRSLNLSVACGIAIYEAHKQINFQNGN